MAKMGKIRVLAMCAFRRDDKVFVSEGYDSQKDQTYYRAIGGGIEFGERAVDALQREVQEELEAPIQDLEYLGTLENIFVYEGRHGHEICMIFDGGFVEAWRNADESVAQGTDDGKHGEEILYTARWIPLDDFRQGKLQLYPQGLLELLDENK